MNSSASDNNEFAIVVDNLCKRFSSGYLEILKNSLLGINKQRKRDFTALENISFKVKKGESVGIIGINGSGKSTLLQVISGILKPSSGSFEVNGKLSALLELGSGFNTDFTGRENIYLNASILGISKTNTEEIIEQIIEFAEIGDFIDKPISTYSSGMTMRLAFAVQVFVEPQILIIDEALSVGDHFFKQKCFEKIDQLLDKGITFLIVSHNEESLRRITNRLILIDNGRVIIDGDFQACIDKYNSICGQKRRKVLGKGTTLSLSKSNEKNADKVAQIRSLKIFNSQDQECHNFISGDEIKIKIEIEVNRFVENLSVGLRVRNKEGLKIYSWSTSNHKLSLSTVSKSKLNNDSVHIKVIQFAFICSLGSNLYQIEAFITDEKNFDIQSKEVLDWVSKAGHFGVTVNKNKDFFGGAVNLHMTSELIEQRTEAKFPLSTIDYSTEYDEYWSRADRLGSDSFQDVQILLDEIKILNLESEILDIGCGMGTLVDRLTKNGFVVVGLDPSKVAVDFCNTYCEGIYQIGSVLNLPFENERFDTTISTDCLEHIAEEDVENAISEIIRVTRRQVYLRIATRIDRDKRWHLTIKTRKWWEDKFLAHGVRLHPLSQEFVNFEQRENESKFVTLIFEKIPYESQNLFSKSWMKQRRKLHADMLRESNRRSDAHIARYQLARELSPQNGLLLDAACGMGYGSKILGCGRPNLEVIGIDSSKDAVSYSTHNYSHVSDNIRFKNLSVYNIEPEFNSNAVDFVCSFETIEHLEEPQKFIKSVFNILKNQGIFICSVPNMWIDDSGKDPNPYHYDTYNFSKISSMLREYFEISKLYVQIAGNGIKHPEMPRTLKEIKDKDCDYLNNIASEWCIVVAKKNKIEDTCV